MKSAPEAPFTLKRVPSPFGTLQLYAEGDRLVGLHFEGRWQPKGIEGRAVVLDAMAEQLTEYFAGKRRAFAVRVVARDGAVGAVGAVGRGKPVPVALLGTAFQREVWQAVMAIPYGETRGYGELASVLGRPAAGRAVGAANGANPLSLIVPCHRLVGSDGKLVKYGGGLEMKRWLIELERAGAPPPVPRAAR